jgi:hypothetical protein
VIRLVRRVKGKAALSEEATTKRPGILGAMKEKRKPGKAILRGECCQSFKPRLLGIEAAFGL